MGRKISVNGIVLIKRYEGCRLTPYKPVPTEQYWTVGYGHYGPDVKPGLPITQYQADAYLEQDLKKFEDYVNNPAYVPITASLTQNQFDALVSFAYNCGAGNLKTLCKGRTASQIAEKIPAYNKAGGKVLAGLTKRRKEEQQLFKMDIGKDVVNSDECPYDKPTVNVRLNNKGDAVAWIQWQLDRLGYSINIDGKFGPKTLETVKAFQKDKGLNIDGVVDKLTRAKLME